MIEYGRAVEPTLAGALRAALLARLPREAEFAVPPDAFAHAVDAFERADATYRNTIGDELTSRNARAVLAATSDFRRAVRSARRTAFDEAARLGVHGDYDLLDIAPPRIANLSHVAAVRLADISDRARARVAALRAEANARIAPCLAGETRTTLLAAKRARVEAFHGAVHAALVPFGAQIQRFSETVEALAALADGWY